MSSFFDELSRRMARGVSRRQSLLFLLVGATGFLTGCTSKCSSGVECGSGCCSSTNVCCSLSNTGTFCCPIAQAVCCPNHICCYDGTTCGNNVCITPAGQEIPATPGLRTQPRLGSGFPAAES